MKRKKIIAREGLVIIGILVLGSVAFFIGSAGVRKYKNRFWQEVVVHKEEYKALSSVQQGEAYGQYMELWSTNAEGRTFQEYGFKSQFWYYLQFIGFWVLFLGYPFWWIMRFVYWAVRTLKTEVPEVKRA